MADHICFIVPPHLLHALADSSDEETSRLAQETLEATRHIHRTREDFLLNSTNPTPQVPAQDIVPDHVLEDIANGEGTDDDAQQLATDTLGATPQFRDLRDSDTSAEASILPSQQINPSTVLQTTTPTSLTRSIYDIQSRVLVTNSNPAVNISMTLLPGTLVRNEGQADGKDQAVNQVYDNSLKVLHFFQKVFNYNSVDGKYQPLISSVHYQKSFQNAFWIGVDTRQTPPRIHNQMVYGDGGVDLVNFTGCIDVIAHEMTHAITQFNAGLLYRNESGALSEHISDVFGIMVKQWTENKSARDADWLIGEGCFKPEQKGIALRNMKDPGTAYTHLNSLGGNDPQPKDVKGMRAFQQDERNKALLDRDNGGTHIFSGIPNRAFVLCALAFGGYSWGKAGQIWWKTLTTNRLAPACTFVEFADVTVDITMELFGSTDAKTVRNAWIQVGVVRSI